MSSKNLHEKPFDEATITKLEIFEKYLEAWLPTFLYFRAPGDLQIWDFFSGQGYDLLGIPGSPIRILEVIKKFEKDIIKSQKAIFICLNDAEKQKTDLLKINIRQFLETIPNLEPYLRIEIHNEDFISLYNSKKNFLKRGNNLIFIDQNGIKQVSEPLFVELISYKTTDFLFFISSSYFKRFPTEFISHHPKLNLAEIQRFEYRKMHLAILNLYKSYVPAGSKNVMLYPFSILKKTVTGFNIYGLIFGAKHLAAVYKFLTVAWDQNKLNGQANYDIEDDLNANQMNLFTGQKRMTKIELFQNDLIQQLLSSDLKTNREVFEYALNKGHVPAHASDVVRKLRDDKKLFFKGQPCISYDAWKDQKELVYSTKPLS